MFLTDKLIFFTKEIYQPNKNDFLTSQFLKIGYGITGIRREKYINEKKKKKNRAGDEMKNKKK